IEHGEGRPVVVTVDSNESAVALAVRDYGLGMNQQEVNHVFDRFWRADPSRKRTIGGTGLGLAISLEDATLHSGWLQVWSAPGAGSCFRLTLPRVPGHGIASSPLPLPPDDAGANNDAAQAEAGEKPAEAPADKTAAKSAEKAGTEVRP
ncbi:MAG TPA: ATP-binding protein, partial [Diaminobutyricibacter sp.]